ncbi:hypothetical protein [Paenibacillus oleatilyticus]|uniref:hypothetical protein n=1 Tax=Paenibacillus oleatilyticus TaxID=2594886 RepID=UPI001C1FC944|nr:hypothetical protein [Paenibacillus oleatilyticus]MBU7316296.1 hypothetical protein [Paenibacillus oleatilyticus]
MLPPEIKRYTEKANKWGLIGAGATLAFTRDPLRAVAVLLAANPRPAFIPAEYGWQQAELVCAENRALLPDSDSLSKLTWTKTLLLEDASALYRVESEEIQCLTKETTEGLQGKINGACVFAGSYAYCQKQGDRLRNVRARG